MNEDRSIARKLGILMLLHMAVGLIAPFVILDTVVRPRGFLVAAANSALQIRIAIFLLFAGSAIPMAMATTVAPIIRRYSHALAQWLMFLAVAGFLLQAVDNGRILSMLSLSQEYARTGSQRQELFQALALVVGAARKWAHYVYLLVAVSWMCLLFAVLYRFRLVPRVLSGLGIVSSLLQIGSVSLLVIMGFAPEMRLAMPLAPCYVALAGWLVWKGFNERSGPSRNEANTLCVAAS